MYSETNPSCSSRRLRLQTHLLHLGDLDGGDLPDLVAVAGSESGVGGTLADTNGLAKVGIGAGEGDGGVGVDLLSNGAGAAVVALGAGSVSSHEGAVLVVEGADDLVGGSVGDGLAPGVVVVEEVVLDLDLLGSLDGGGGLAVDLAERAKDGGADAPLASDGTAPAVVGPRLEGGLDEVAGAVGHAGPEEEDTGLGGRSGTGGQVGDGVDDGGGGGAEGDGAAPGVALGDVVGGLLTAEKAGEGHGGGREGGQEESSELHGCGSGLF